MGLGGTAAQVFFVRSMRVQYRLAELRSREIVNIADGQRLGRVEDILVDTSCGRIVALVVPGPGRFLGFFPGDDILIRWECVKRIGDDLILIEKSGDPERCRRPIRFRF